MIAAAARPPKRGRSRAAGFFNAAVSLLALLIIVPLALQVSHEPPPTVAEFAPQVKQQIKVAPPSQSSQFGKAGGGTSASNGAGSGGSGGSINVPENLIKHCVGDPPRQIEDPQSPPCVPYYPLQADNGGATSPGVTKDRVTIALPVDCQKPDGSAGESALEYNLLPVFFNKRFEFYNRTITTYCYQTGNGSTLQSQEESDAEGVAAASPFASTMYRNGAGYYYMKRLACVHHVISVSYYVQVLAKSYIDQCPGYIYQYTMDQDSENAALGQWACSRLVPGKAVHAGGNDNSVPAQPLSSHERKFGVIYEPFYDDEPSALGPLLTELAGCGVHVPDKDVLHDPIQDPPGTAAPEDPTAANNAVLQMKNDGITSILCVCNFYSFGAFTRAADSQSYQPEWLLNSYGGVENTVFQVALGEDPPDQLNHTFGITFKPRQLPPAEEPYYQAMREADPTQTPKGPDSVDVEVDQEVYRDFLLLMSGIQMAGPHLTPQTFARGLEQAQFPNPETPLMAGHVGFAGYTYAMTIDAAEWWIGNGQPSPYPDASAATCYVLDGKRYVPGSFPKGGDPFFKPPCYGVT